MVSVLVISFCCRDNLVSFTRVTKIGSRAELELVKGDDALLLGKWLPVVDLACNVEALEEYELTESVLKAEDSALEKRGALELNE